MAEAGGIDTSSYPKPDDKSSSFLDIAQGYQKLESNKLSIDKQKLDLVNQKYNYLLREVNSTSKDATSNELVDMAQRSLNMKFIDPDMFKEFVRGIPTDPSKVPAYRDQIATKLATTQEAVNFHYGAPGAVDNGQQVTPTRQGLRGPPVAAGLPIQRQLPPGAEVATPQGPQALGAQNPQLPPGAVPASGIPGQFSPTPVKPVIVTPGSNNRLGAVPSRPGEPPMGEPASPNERVSQGFNSLQPRGPMTGQPPMFEEGKKQLAQDQEMATQKLTAIKPALQALPLLKDIIAGPGTDKYTKALAGLKGFGILSTSANDPVAVRQEVAKKLAQYVSSNPVGQRSDAAQTLAEASSPNPNVQILPALIKLTKDAIILDRVQAARPNAFESSNLAEYGKHRSTFPASIDEKAFGLDLMEPKERNALIKEMKEKKNTFEGKKFWKSLAILDKQGLIDTGGQ